MAGRLIVIDGLDGSGKATQTDLLVKFLVQHLTDTQSNYKVETITFPDYNSMSSAAVKMYLNGDLGKDPSDVNAYAASSFYAVDRYISFKTKWEQQYRENTIFVADRYTTSNAIHQMAKLSDEDEKQQFQAWLDDFEYNKLGLPKPDLVIYLDMTPQVSQKLISDRYADDDQKDIHEANLQYLIACRKNALYCATEQNWKVIACDDGAKAYPIEEIHQKIRKIITEDFYKK